ncbi:hypothetical protein SpCBS45565_g06479 [Spizellomyces sp. 'palustris']|nr:hypothetical protein SpCBS45565_g06479 [Spizellomyces sp. 'palustris']
MRGRRTLWALDFTVKTRTPHSRFSCSQRGPVSQQAGWRPVISSSHEQFVKGNTTLVRPKLTPELQLNLITPNSPMWTWGEYELDNSGIGIPYWAVYWPGGQALTKHILTTPSLVRNKVILDLGSGCGSVCAAALLNGAKLAIANDVDPYALAASKLNVISNLGSAKSLILDSRNCLTPSPAVFKGVDIAWIGDMFYDSDMSLSVRRWIKEARNMGMEVFVGDPGRHAFSDEILDSSSETVEFGDVILNKVGEYEMVKETTEYLEENAFTTGVVWRKKGSDVAMSIDTACILMD